MKVSCPHCSMDYTIKRATVGQKFYCNACSKYFFASEKDIQTEETLPQQTTPILEDYELPPCDLFDLDPLDEKKEAEQTDLIPNDEDEEIKNTPEPLRSKRQNRREEERKKNTDDSLESQEEPPKNHKLGPLALSILSIIGFATSPLALETSPILAATLFLSSGLFLFFALLIKLGNRIADILENPTQKD